MHLGTSRPAQPAPGNPDTPPRYYVALVDSGLGKPVNIGALSGSRLSPADAVVRVTATGKAVATVTPPRPYQEFGLVTAAADDRTFVLDAIRGGSGADKLFLLRLGPGGRPGRLIPLRVPPPVSNGVTDLALSPNGALLAVQAGGGKPSLFVVDLATGAERKWVPAGIGTNNNLVGTQDSLSWTADSRTLALIFYGDPGGGGVRLLDVTARGPNLLANSRLVVGQPKNVASRGYWSQARVTPDGQTIIAVRDRTGHYSQQLAEFSAQTGKVLRVLNNLRFIYGSDEKVGWASPSGNVLIVLNAKRGSKLLMAYVDANAGVLRNGHYTALPWPSDDTFAVAW
jgi:WD40 repeat protein